MSLSYQLLASSQQLPRHVIAAAMGLTIVAGLFWAPLAAKAASQASATVLAVGCASDGQTVGAQPVPTTQVQTQAHVQGCAGPSSVVFWPAQAGDPAAHAAPLARPLCRVALTLQRAAMAGLMGLSTGIAATRLAPLAPLPGCTARQWDNAPIVWYDARRYRMIARALLAASSVPSVPSGAIAAHARLSAAPVRTVTATAARVAAIRAQAHRAAALHLPAYVPLGVQSSSPTDTAGLLLLAGKFALVLVLLFICLRVLRAVMPRLSGGVSSGPMILHSESIGAKQNVQILDLGVRLVVIGVTGATMTALTTIEREDEMDALRARYGKAPLRVAPRSGDAADASAAAPATSAAAAARPTFTQALAIATTQSLGRRGRPSGRASAPDVPSKGGWTPETSAAMSAYSTDTETHGGDPVLGRALDAVRALRRKIEQS